MASAIPKMDKSARWPRHTCGVIHQPGAWCPVPNRWLIAGTPISEPYPKLVRLLN